MKRWGYLVILCAFILACIVTLTGCATLTTGNSQAITIGTKPQGATCTLTRDGKVVGVVNPTPGTVNVDKSKNDISIICTKDGFQDETTACTSNFQGMTFGNILFGGLIGIAVDAGSGAMHKYPTEFTILLFPIEFKSVAERDIFFDSMKADCLTETAKLMEETSKRCDAISDDTKTACLAEMKATETKRDTRLSEIENKRNSAKIKAEEQTALPAQ